LALEEEPREDLLREATALVRRGVWSGPTIGSASAPQIVAGFRRNGALSLFFDETPVYQFNPTGELRRAHSDGLLYKADRGRLFQMRRERAERQTTLVSRALTDEEQAALLAEAEARITALFQALEANQLSRIGQVPDDADLRVELLAWRDEHPLPLQIADRPNAAG
jgi:hypothetical protein